MKKRKIAISDLRISNLAKKYISQALDSNRLTYGPLSQEFEKEFARIHGRKFAVFVNSGTSGLQLALHAMKEIYNWHDDDEILVPSITFIGTVNAVLHNRLKPVFVDVEEDYYCIDPTKIEDKITQKTRGIMPVHLFGQSSDMKRILRIAQKHNLKVIEDSCETMFVKYLGKMVGSMGDISVYSTYASHIIATGVGGLVTTNNTLFAETIKSLAFHGRDNIYLKIEDDDTNDPSKLKSLIKKRFQFNHVGYSFRLTELEAALGLAELKHAQLTIKRRVEVGENLNRILSPFSKFFILPKKRPNSQHAYMLFPIVIRDKRIKRNHLLLFLEKNGIETRPLFPLLSQPIYKKLFNGIEKKYPVARKLAKQGFIIGSHPYISSSDIQYLQNLFNLYLRHEKLLE